MAGPPKKSRKPSETSSDESDSENHYFTEEIQADFEGRNPESHDFHGIKQLLKQLFLKAHVDLSALSEMLIQQTGVGSVLKQSFNDDEDEDDSMADSSDVYGITSVLNLSAHLNEVCVQQLLGVIVELAKQYVQEDVVANVEEKLKKKVGLVVNERFINIPPKIADPLFTSLVGELDRIKKKDPSYNFEYLIMICKCYKPKGVKDAEITFSNAEEEVFAKEADVQFTFDVSKESDTGLGGKWLEGDVEMVPHRSVLFIKAQNFSHIVQQVKLLVG